MWGVRPLETASSWCLELSSDPSILHWAVHPPCSVAGTLDTVLAVLPGMRSRQTKEAMPMGLADP